jgi:hypothetical protein
LFWQGKKLASGLNISGQLYPNLFAFDISDLHTYSLNGKITKTNCYSTYFDLISGKNNTPVVFQNFGCTLAKSIMELNGLKDIFNKFNSIKSNVDEFFINLFDRLECAEWDTGSVRAEFRMKFCDSGSMIPLIDAFFSINNIKDWALAFDTGIITRLAKFYVHALKKQFIENLLWIMMEFERRNVNHEEIFERVATISILESLITSTLFSGLTYSFVSELVWNKSNNERRSLELMKFIKSNNRLVFDELFFIGRSFKVSAPSHIMEIIFKKINRNQVFQFPPIDLILQFYRTSDNQEKANTLFKIYFAELNPNAFLDNGFPRWKLASLNTDVITGFNNDKLQFRGAMRAVFNFEKLVRYPAWKNRYYLKLAEEWTSIRGGLKLEVLDNLLVQSIRLLEIEHIHYAGTTNYNGNSSRHIKIDWTNQNSNSQQRSNVYAATISDRDTSLLARSRNGMPTQWLDHDIMILVEGVNKYKNFDKKLFDYIYTDSLLKFKFRREVPKMKTKWRQLVSSGSVREDGDRWIIPGLRLNYERNFTSAANLRTYSPLPSPRSSPIAPTVAMTPVLLRQLNESNISSSSSSSENGTDPSLNTDSMPEDMDLNDFPSYPDDFNNSVANFSASVPPTDIENSSAELMAPLDIDSFLPELTSFNRPFNNLVTASSTASQSRLNLLPEALTAVESPVTLAALTYVPSNAQLQNFSNDNMARTDSDDYIEDLMNILAAGQSQNEQIIETDTIQPQTQSILTNQSYSRQQRRPSRAEIAAELEASPELQIIFDIISRYFISPSTSFTVTKKLYNLGPNDSLALSSLVYAACSSNRLDKVSQLRLVEELSSTNLFIISHPKNNATKIKRCFNANF